MSAATEAILDAVIPLAPVENLRMLVGMIEDRIGGDAGLDKLGEAVAFAQANWSPLFNKVTPVTPQATSAPPPVNETVTQRVLREAREQRQAPVAPAGEPNPWAAGTINITRQVLLMAKEPDRAARLKAEAGR